VVKFLRIFKLARLLKALKFLRSPPPARPPARPPACSTATLQVSGRKSTYFLHYDMFFCEVANVLHG
jgi:hypothetical protein